MCKRMVLTVMISLMVGGFAFGFEMNQESIQSTYFMHTPKSMEQEDINSVVESNASGLMMSDSKTLDSGTINTITEANLSGAHMDRDWLVNVANFDPLKRTLPLEAAVMILEGGVTFGIERNQENDKEEVAYPEAKDGSFAGNSKNSGENSAYLQGR